MHKISEFVCNMQNYGNTSMVFRTKGNKSNLVLNFEFSKYGELVGTSYLESIIQDDESLEENREKIYLGALAEDTINCTLASLIWQSVNDVENKNYHMTVDYNYEKGDTTSATLDLSNKVISMINFNEDDLEFLATVDRGEAIWFVSKRPVNNESDKINETLNIPTMEEKMDSFVNELEKKKANVKEVHHKKIKTKHFNGYYPNY